MAFGSVNPQVWLSSAGCGLLGCLNDLMLVAGSQCDLFTLTAKPIPREVAISEKCHKNHS